MKKLFSLFAAVLMASSMMAQFDTWSVVGSKAIMNGTADWAITETANDMATEDGVTYTLTVTGKTLEVGTTYEYKYAKGHAWTVSVPQSGNLSFTVAETAVYDIVYTVNVSDKTHSAVATKSGEAGEITHVYSIAGSSADLFGAAWSETATATEMTKGEDGIYSWTREGVELAAATIEYKVVVDHAWGEAYPSSNAKLVIAEAGTYNVVVTFNPADKAVNAVASKVGGEPGPGPEPEPEAENVTFTVTVPEGTKACYIAGNFNGWSFAEMTAGEGVYTYTTEDKFLANTLEYKYLSGADWKYVEVREADANRTYAAADEVSAWKETYDPEAPAAPQDTIYFVNTLGWEKVYIHAWGGTGVSTEWSSCPELNKVDYQLKGYDVYMFEAIEGYYGRLLFKNASGDVAQGDDVRTADLDWTSGKYYYKGLWMTRAEVEAPDPVLTYDTTMYVAGNFTEWAAGMKTLPYTIALPADSALEYKLVREVITYADEVEAKRDTTWYGAEKENSYMTRESNAWLLDGNFDVLLTTDVEGEYTFSLEEGVFTVTFPEMEEPKDQEYGIMVNGDTFVAAVKNEEYVGEGEEWVVNVTFEGDELFHIYNKTTEAGWIIAQSESSQKTFALTEEEDNFVVADAGEYTLYIKIIYNADEMYVAYNDPSVKHYDYYLVGTAAVDGWDVTKAMPMENDEITRSLEAGTYEFKIINATIIAGEDPSWSSALDYDDLNTECSSEGVEGSSNVKFTLKEAGDVTIKVVEGTICVTGNFGEVVITVYTIAGQEALMGVDWKVDATENDLTKGEDGLWRLMKTDVELMAETYYYFKVVANHAWGVADYPETDANLWLMPNSDGVYDLEFVWNAEESNMDVNFTWKRALPTTYLEMLMQDGAVKVLRGGNLYIIREGKIYNAAGLLVK